MRIQPAIQLRASSCRLSTRFLTPRHTVPPFAKRYAPRDARMQANKHTFKNSELRFRRRDVSGVGARKTLIQLAYFAMVILLSSVGYATDTFQESSVLTRRLRTRTNSVLDGQTFRVAMQKLADANQINIWFDRNINPSATVTIGPVGPTVYLAMDQLARSQSCEAMPISNVLLVGRPAWIDRMIQAIFNAPTSAKGQLIDLEWDALTTPSEALKRLPKHADNSGPSLPHDHWPETKLQQIPSGIAEILIRGQFAVNHDHNDGLSESPRNGRPTIYRAYTLDPPTSRAAITELPSAVPDAELRKTSTGLSIRATVKDHRIITQWILSRHESHQDVDVNSDTFSLNRMSTTAENAFLQLAKTANLQCIIDDNAKLACKRMVTLEGKDVTLRFLMEQIAQQIGVELRWQPSTVTVTQASDSPR